MGLENENLELKINTQLGILEVVDVITQIPQVSVAEIPVAEAYTTRAMGPIFQQEEKKESSSMEKLYALLIKMKGFTINLTKQALKERKRIRR